MEYGRWINILTITTLIDFLHEFGLSEQQIKNLNLDKILTEINKELYVLTAKILKEKYVQQIRG